MTLITRGDRELALRLDTFPEHARAKIKERIDSLTDKLLLRVKQAAPYRTGLLRSEIKGRTFASERTDRVSGYVSIYAPQRPKEYAKAATLEYGSDKARRVFDRASRGKRRIVAKLSRPARIEAFAYLRGPFEEMRPEIETEIDAALAESVADINS